VNKFVQFLIAAASVAGAWSGSASADVRRYKLEQILPVGQVDESRPGLVTAIVDIWEGESEHVLISAGFSIELVEPSIAKNTVVRIGRRRLITQDVKKFQTQNGRFYSIEMGDSPSGRSCLLIDIDSETRQLSAYFSEMDLVLGGQTVTTELLPEQSYKPVRMTGRPEVFESGNLPVNFYEFFRSKRNGFLGKQTVAQPLEPKEDPAPKVETVKPEPLIENFANLSKKQRKKLKQQQKRAEKEAAKQADKEESKSSSVSWITSGRRFNHGPIFKPSPPKPPAKVQIENFDSEVDALLAKDDKPSLSDMIAFVKAVKAAQPDYDLTQNPFREFMWGGNEKIHRAMAQMESVREKLEKAFPDATWYLLGRDVYLLNDALEAVYRMHGETDRVRRLPASQPSFNDVSLDVVDGFLKSNGLDVDRIGKNSRPQIILDISSYSDSKYRLSQSRHLMRAAYDRWTSLGRDPRDLADKVNFVNVSRTHSHSEVESREGAQRFLRDLKFEPEPLEILSVYAPGEFLYTDGWHGLYEKFQRQENGEVTAGHGYSSSRDTRLSMLGELWAVVTYYGNGLLEAASCENKLKKE
jgi:hypothetical protein